MRDVDLEEPMVGHLWSFQQGLRIVQHWTWTVSRLDSYIHRWSVAGARVGSVKCLIVAEVLVSVKDVLV